jgi:UDP-GlcNAc:undecaprenyl-phosphate GlcNAc-1-phosphate transferase
MNSIPSEMDLAIIGLGLLLGFVFTPVVIRYAARWGLLDVPEGALKIHSLPTPRSGGVAIFAGFLCVTLMATLLDRPMLSVQELSMATLLFGLGLWDDRDSRSPRLRMVLQVLIYGLGFLLDVRIVLGAPLIVEFVVGLIVFVAVINGINFYDGADGLLSLTAIAGLGVWSAIGLTAGADVLPYLVFVALLAGFVRANWHPARIFLGDGGSFLVGFFFYLVVARSSGTDMGFLAGSWVCAVPVCDAIAATVDRRLSRRNVWEGDRDHVYDILSRLGWSTPQVATSLAIITALCARTAAFIPQQPELVRWSLTIGVYVFLAVGIFVLRRRFAETAVATTADI